MKYLILLISLVLSSQNFAFGFGKNLIIAKTVRKVVKKKPKYKKKKWLLEVLEIAGQKKEEKKLTKGRYELPEKLNDWRCEVSKIEKKQRRLDCFHGETAVGIVASENPDYSTLSSLILYKKVQGATLESTHRLTIKFR